MSNYDANIMDWNSAIESDGQVFVTLPEGDYNFEVTNFERSHYPGSAKIPPCPKAALTLQVNLPDGTIGSCREDLILYRSMEWKLAEFFRSIGQKKMGERMVMDWSKVMGQHGRAHFKPRSYIGKNGDERTANAVDHYIEYDPKNFENDWVRDAQHDVQSNQVQQATWMNGGGF